MKHPIQFPYFGEDSCSYMERQEARLRDHFPAALELCARLDAGHDLIGALGFAYEASRAAFGRATAFERRPCPPPMLRVPRVMRSERQP